MRPARTGLPWLSMIRTRADPHGFIVTVTSWPACLPESSMAAPRWFLGSRNSTGADERGVAAVQLEATAAQRLQSRCILTVIQLRERYQRLTSTASRTGWPAASTR